ncbi:MAG: hypothetical protein IEMM0008_1895 [bacterium]|nr:MAG: hypothetical protein IEMM0008_1895 [bacterium]
MKNGKKNGNKKAIVAVARKMIETIYVMMQTGDSVLKVKFFFSVLFPRWVKRHLIVEYTYSYH